MCVNAHNHSLIPMESFFWFRRHSGHELDLGKIKPSLIVRISLFSLYTLGQYICFWYPLLVIRIPLNLSVGLFGWSYHLMSLHDFFPWMSTDTHIRFLAVHWILWWITVQLILHIQKPLGSIRDTNWLWWVKSSVLTSVLYFRRCTPLFLMFAVLIC